MPSHTLIGCMTDKPIENARLAQDDDDISIHLQLLSLVTGEAFPSLVVH